ncbi:hypothetical protein [Thioalkalivibrio sp.]|uniref:hypothetical protein n=1 Tax=Thioalkalivibrio sp. TaxID=2093813 RepID=UPI003976D85E
MRGQIDYRAGLVRQRIDCLKHQVWALARSPAALPIAFGCGFLAERLRVPGIRYVYGLVAGQVKALQIASTLIGSPLR